MLVGDSGEDHMTVKLCPHVEVLGKCRWLGTKVQTPGEWVKIMDPGAGISRRFPGKKLVGRWYIPNEDEYIRQGAVGADKYFMHLWPKYNEVAGELAAAECVNEPVVNSGAQAETWAAFLSRWIWQMHRFSWPTAVPAFSMGNPEMWVLPSLRRVLEETDYATLHEYSRKWMGEPETPFLLLRHRMIYERLAELGIRQPPLLVTETGIDRGGVGYRQKPGATPWPSYLSQLAWLEDELQQDSYVVASFLFNSGGTHNWKSFDLGEGEWTDLAKRLSA